MYWIVALAHFKRTQPNACIQVVSEPILILVMRVAFKHIMGCKTILRYTAERGKYPRISKNTKD